MGSSSATLFLLCFALFSLAANAYEVSHDGRAMSINGERKILISGTIHYPRSTAEMWPSLINKAKEGGLQVIETYVFWNAHEPLRRQYDFSGNLDLVRFIKTVQSEGLYVLLRIGPYVCAEWSYGGFPVWLHNIPNIKFRTKNDAFMSEMKNFTTLIVDMMKTEKLFASQGGPIIAAQIENEYGNVNGPYGDDGKEYIKWCAQLADSYQIGVPWVMCQQDDAPPPMLNTCNGWYCDQWQPNSNSTPKIWTENWTGWYKNWGNPNPHRTAEDLAFSVARFFQYGGSFQNYYMYHGGTNFGRTAGGPYITTSYDYDAPLDEYGNKNQPKWGHLKQLHLLLKSMEKILTHGVYRNIEFGNQMTATVYSYAGRSVCFLGNADDSRDATINFRNTNYTIPAWSVSILPDCYTEVSAQTSTMGMKENEADDAGEPFALKWRWMYEPYDQLLNSSVSGSKMSASVLLDQKVVTNDTSDYLWYTTSFDVKKTDPIWGKEVKLRVNTSGHGLHAFVNGGYVGSQYANYSHYKFQYESVIQLQLGKNEIALLSATVGLANYGSFFDNVEVGIHGPVELVADAGNNETITMDLSTNKWVYKVGLQGERDEFYNPLKTKEEEWLTRNLPTNSIFVWYKTTFKSPLGNDPVVVDLMGLGKGFAWVNGNNIGRYWTSYLADQDGCSSTCDYRGTYGSTKCLTKCGEPSQRWYHVPRSFLRDDGDNTFIVLEELGGSPYNVKFQTVTVGRASAHAYEGHKLELSCQGERVISEIKFASFGQPKGEIGSFEKGHCESPKALSVIKKKCVGKESCSMRISEKVLGSTGCNVEQNRLAVEAICDTKVNEEASNLLG
ncbi:hypothetical protein L6164_026698 [Bauhinia variegata]|uniref:Uncharacterized protein n=2 Tax=Bauhinia variegata TaxID=167791 RepID=A0ACB9LQL3_BAUVA|nr:hypothetical protein L6164_026698 [Bauhinia variegata]